ncbi:MAG: sensor histidine kinase [Acidobacteriota bacterium]
MATFRLLPPGQDLSWTPFGHLGYLIFFAAQPVLSPQIPHERWWSALALLIFLAAYFRGYWTDDERVLGPIAVMCGLGLVFAQWNMAASCFFIYAGAFAHQIGAPRRAIRVVLAVLALAIGVAMTYQPSPAFWGPAVLFTPLVAGFNMHLRLGRLAAAQLRQSRNETERLAKVAERERIARDLHDLLGHTLSIITLKAELASHLADRDSGRAADEMRDVEHIARQAMKEVRTAVSGYQKRSLAEEILQMRTTLDAAGIELDLAVDPHTDPALKHLDPTSEGVLSMALREAITNVIRHSKASHCVVCLHRDRDKLYLEVSDDGIGARAPEGSGLAGMRERLAGLGGELERIVDDGTTLKIRLPAGSPA